MTPPLRDLAQIRFENALVLFDEFVHTAVKHADAATLRGLDGRFAERLLIQPSYWSQIKARSRQIGERLARQFEQRCHKPGGWLDESHGPARRAAPGDAPADDDERFIVSLVLGYYRRHPERAKTRLLELLGEALQATDDAGVTQPGTTAHTGDAQLWSHARAAVAPLKRKR